MGIQTTKRPVAPVSATVLKPPLTQQEKLEARIRLLQNLQVSQAPEDILQNFFRHIQPLVTVTGIHFEYAQNHIDTRCGKDAVHHCDYCLNTQDGYLGNIIFSRNKRFSEEELATLESLLSGLVYPLRNAFNYEAALRLSLLDPLTGLGNRAALDSALHRELQLAERHQQSLSLLMIDIDHFKQINDLHGHSVGDEVLKAVAASIQGACRDSDISFRFGGEEFVVLLRKTDADGARIIAERIRQQISLLTLGDTEQPIKPTASIGIGTHEPGIQEHIRDMFERADKALYRAKTQGRNRTMDIAS
jgi:diguanylate cyclase (GGDEF)-like protein